MLWSLANKSNKFLTVSEDNCGWQNASYDDRCTLHYSGLKWMFARGSPVSINCLCIFWKHQLDFVWLNTFQLLRGIVWSVVPKTAGYIYDVVIYLSIHILSFHSGKLSVVETDKKIFHCVKVISSNPELTTQRNIFLSVPIHG